jgi:hypothetical protein
MLTLAPKAHKLGHNSDQSVLREAIHEDHATIGG